MHRQGLKPAFSLPRLRHGVKVLPCRRAPPNQSSNSPHRTCNSRTLYRLTCSAGMLIAASRQDSTARHLRLGRQAPSGPLQEEPAEKLLRLAPEGPGPAVASRRVPRLEGYSTLAGKEKSERMCERSRTGGGRRGMKRRGGFPHLYV